MVTKSMSFVMFSISFLIISNIPFVFLTTASFELMFLKNYM